MEVSNRNSALLPFIVVPSNLALEAVRTLDSPLNSPKSATRRESRAVTTSTTVRKEPVRKASVEVLTPLKKPKKSVKFDPSALLLHVCQHPTSVDDPIQTITECLASNTEQKFDINEIFSPHQWLTPLHVACSHGNVEITKLLLENGAYVNVYDTEGWTPLHCASAEGHTEILKLLGQCQGKTGDVIKPNVINVADGPIDLEPVNEDGDLPEDVAFETKEDEINTFFDDLKIKYPPPIRPEPEEGEDIDESDDGKDALAPPPVVLTKNGKVATFGMERSYSVMKPSITNDKIADKYVPNENVKAPSHASESASKSSSHKVALKSEPAITLAPRVIKTVETAKIQDAKTVPLEAKKVEPLKAPTIITPEIQPNSSKSVTKDLSESHSSINESLPKLTDQQRPTLTLESRCGSIPLLNHHARKASKGDLEIKTTVSSNKIIGVVVAASSPSTYNPMFTGDRPGNRARNASVGRSPAMNETSAGDFSWMDEEKGHALPRTNTKILKTTESKPTPAAPETKTAEKVAEPSKLDKVTVAASSSVSDLKTTFFVGDAKKSTSNANNSLTPLKSRSGDLGSNSKIPQSPSMKSGVSGEFVRNLTQLKSVPVSTTGKSTTAIEDANLTKGSVKDRIKNWSSK
jgi:Ankyrin repeats (3 copies)